MPLRAAPLARWLRRRPLQLLRALGWVAFGRFGERVTVRRRAASLLALVRGAALAEEPGVRLFHAQFANEAATAAMIASLLACARFSFRSHTARAPQLLGRKLLRATVVLSITEDDRRRLLALAPEAHVEVARLGVEVPPQSGVEREPGLVVAVGSLIEKKGHHVLAEAIGLLRTAGRDVRCEIAGEGPWRAVLERTPVELRGRLDRSEVAALLDRATVFAMPSVTTEGEGEDGLPVALLEALARGTPVVATRLSALPEAVRDRETGLLVPPGDAGALADAIAALLDDAVCAAELGRAGRELVRSEYDPVRTYARAAALLAEAAR